MSGLHRAVYVDVLGGAAGDMLLAALLDAGAPMEAVREAVEAVLPGRFLFGPHEVRRSGIRAVLLQVQDGARPPHGGGGGPRPLIELLAAVEEAALTPAVRSGAMAVLRRLGGAEAHVHGSDADSDLGNVHLHELGEDDTLLDVVGVCAALEAMDVREVLVSSIPLGSAGPVTLELLEGFSVRFFDGDHERVTPTGAALLATLGTPAGGLPEMRLERTGYGAGTRDPAGYPNVVRVVVGSLLEPAGRSEGVGDGAADVGGGGRARQGLVVLEANLDDLTPELLADAAAELLSRGALDAWTTPILMKKGRPGFVLSALCEQDRAEELAEAFFETTTTFGVRSVPVGRYELLRRVVEVPVGPGSVRIKVGTLGDRVMSLTPEHDDVAELAREAGRPVRALYEEALLAARAMALQEAAP